MNWLKQQVANVAGTAEPIYGPAAIQTVTAQSTAGPAYTELSKEGLKWVAPHYTCVETQCFYIYGDDGRFAMCQVIYSNVAGLRTTCQFNTKIYDHGGPGTHQWTSDPLHNHKFDKEKYSFHADNLAVDMSEDGTYYTIKASTSPKCQVDLTFKRVAPGFVAGQNGVSNFGTDPKNPWGSMRHAFWPRCKVTGSFKTKEGELAVSGKGCFIHALQGMKPHHAAARWNFANLQTSTYSAIMMEFTTPPSYGSTVVNVGCIATDDKLLYAGVSNKATHTTIKQDDEVNWPEPGAVSFEWNKQGPVSGESTLSLETRTDRVDVMAEVPGFVKQIVSSAAGTRPYIYQYAVKAPLSVKQDGSESKEEGGLFMEATFIS